MEKFREIKCLKKLFWDYKFEAVSERMFLQRIIDYWPIIVTDLNKGEISAKEFDLILSLIQKNFNRITFRYPIVKNIIKKLIERRFGNGC